MTAAGVMGYTFETRANVEYWFDPHDDIFQKSYAHNACGMIWSGSIVWGTWFSASPAWIYGIQWLPVSPHGAFYERKKGLVTSTFADVMRELAAFEAKEAAKNNKPPKAANIQSLGGELGSYHLGFLMHGDAPRVVAEIDKLWAMPGDQVAHNEWMLVTYSMASALVELGQVDWTAHGDSPTSMVYAKEGRRTLVAWNPTARPRTVAFTAGGKSIGSLTVPPHSLASQPASP
jgi:hypothetical protein